MLTTLILSFLSLAELTSALAQCFCKLNGAITTSCYDSVPCATVTGFTQCCNPSDTCGADGFCHFTHPDLNRTGFYLGGCTDPTFSDPSCVQSCSNNPVGDVVYNPATTLWACCFSKPEQPDPNCSSPGLETFQAPAPSILFATPFSLLLASSKPTATPVMLGTNLTQSSVSSMDSSLTTGQIVGITIGTSVVFMACFLVVFILLLKRARRNSHQLTTKMDLMTNQIAGLRDFYEIEIYQRMAAMDQFSNPTEISSERVPRELHAARLAAEMANSYR